jgi:hypothetical protein
MPLRRLNTQSSVNCFLLRGPQIEFTAALGGILSPSSGSAEAPLNYFIDPYVKVGGKQWPRKVTTRFSLEEVPTPAVGG